jgi:hypothetical protein
MTPRKLWILVLDGSGMVNNLLQHLKAVDREVISIIKDTSVKGAVIVDEFIHKKPRYMIFLQGVNIESLEGVVYCCSDPQQQDRIEDIQKELCGDVLSPS